MVFYITEAPKIGVAAMGIHVLSAQPDHSACEGATAAALFDIIVAEMICRLHAAQCVPLRTAVRFPEEPRCCAVHFCPQTYRAGRQLFSLAAIGEVFIITSQNAQDTGIDPFIPGYIGVDPVAGIVKQHQAGHLLKIFRRKIKSGFGGKGKVLRYDDPAGKFLSAGFSDIRVASGDLSLRVGSLH